MPKRKDLKKIKAEADGHKVMSVAEATKQGDIIHILLPDMIQGQIYKDEIAPNLSEGKALSFSHDLVREFRHDEHGPPPERLLGPEDVAVDVVPDVQHLRAGGHAEHGVEVPVAPALIRLCVRARGIPVVIRPLAPRTGACTRGGEEGVSLRRSRGCAYRCC